MDRFNFLGFTAQMVIAAIAAGLLGWLLYAQQIADLGTCILIPLVLFALVYVALRDFHTATTLKALDQRFEDFAEFEADMDRRLAQKQNAVLTDQASTDHAQRAQIVSALQAVVERVAALEQRAGAVLHSMPASIPTPNEDAKLKDGHSTSGILAKPSALNKIDLKQALRDDALSVHLQPVVDLSERRPINYEASMRLKLPAGDYLDSGQFHKLAQKGGLLPMLDRKLIHTSQRMLETLKMLKKQAGLFSNISAELLEDAATFREVRRFLEGEPDCVSSLVLEISQRDLRHLKTMAKDRLNKLVDLGIALSLDNTMDLRLDIPALHRQGFRFVKIPAGILLHASVDDNAPALPSELAAALSEAGMTLIATDVERENDVLSLIDFQVTLAQGLLFAPPRPIKAELLNKSPSSGAKAAVSHTVA